jgi:hypothetical protein
MPVMRFKPDVIEALAGHGLRPGPATTPAQLRDFIHDVYLFEIRKLRDRCRAGEFPRRELARRVVELRTRYRLLSLAESEWLESA